MLRPDGHGGRAGLGNHRNAHGARAPGTDELRGGVARGTEPGRSGSSAPGARLRRPGRTLERPEERLRVLSDARDKVHRRRHDQPSPAAATGRGRRRCLGGLRYGDAFSAGNVRAQSHRARRRGFGTLPSLGAGFSRCRHRPDRDLSVGLGRAPPDRGADDLRRRAHPAR